LNNPVTTTPQQKKFATFQSQNVAVGFRVFVSGYWICCVVRVSVFWEKWFKKGLWLCIFLRVVGIL